MLDIQTMFYYLFLTKIIITSVFFLYWKTQKTYPGFYEWTLSLFLAALADILFALRGIIPDLLTISIANTFSFLGFVLMLDALKIYFTDRRLTRELYLYSIPLLVTLFYFTEYVESALIRNIIFSLSVIVVISLTIKVLLKEPKPSEKLFSRLLASG